MAMQERSSSQRGRLALGLGAMLAGAAMLVGAFPGYAGATSAQTEPTSSTSEVDGNPTCGQLEPNGADWTEFKIEPVEDGEFTQGPLTVTIVVRDTDDGPVFDWTSNIGVDAVFVKGGPGGLLYVYDPESTGDTGLHAPVNPENDKFYGLSHLSFCYDADQATTSTTDKDTTTTTEKDTTTTTEQETTTTTEHDTTTTTEHGDTTTTAAGVTSTTVLGGTTPTTQPGGGLPRTGNNSGPLLALGAALLGGGTALVAATRKFRQS